MAVIKCRNTRNEKNKIVKCNRFFFQVPQCVIDSLKNNPGMRMIARCPTCPSYQRWTAIYYDVKYGLVWESIKKPEPEQFDSELEFDIVKNSKQIA